jgi:hypothetical protein
LPEVTVYDDKGRAVGAKILRDPTGSPILEPITGLPLIVDEDFEVLLDDLIVRLSSDCPWRDGPRGSCALSIQRPPLV